MRIRALLRPVAAAAILALLWTHTASAASVVGMKSDMEGTPPTVDVLLLRPIALSGLIAGSVLFVPVAALTVLFRQDLEKPFDTLVRRPYEYVFVDPLGEH